MKAAVATTSLLPAVPCAIWPALDFGAASRHVEKYSWSLTQPSGPVRGAVVPIAIVDVTEADSSPKMPSSDSFCLGPPLSRLLMTASAHVDMTDLFLSPLATIPSPAALSAALMVSPHPVEPSTAGPPNTVVCVFCTHGDNPVSGSRLAAVRRLSASVFRVLPVHLHFRGAVVLVGSSLAGAISRSLFEHC